MFIAKQIQYTEITLEDFIRFCERRFENIFVYIEILVELN